MSLMRFFRKRVVIITILVILAGMVTAGIIGLYLYNDTHKDLGMVKADYKMNAGELISEFMSDEESATEKYVNRVIEIRGPVQWAEMGVADSTLSITLKREDDQSGVICTFNGVTDESKIKAGIGDTITVRGICSGMLMDILLNNCVLVKD